MDANENRRLFYSLDTTEATLNDKMKRRCFQSLIGFDWTFFASTNTHETELLGIRKLRAKILFYLKGKCGESNFKFENFDWSFKMIGTLKNPAELIKKVISIPAERNRIYQDHCKEQFYNLPVFYTLEWFLMNRWKSTVMQKGLSLNSWNEIKQKSQ